MQLHSPPPPAPPATTATTTSPFLKEHTRTTLYIIIITSFFSLFFIVVLPFYPTRSHLPTRARPDPFLFPNRLSLSSEIPFEPAPPSIAYLISGSSGEAGRILRLLFATYHPKNHYLLHLDLSAPQTERDLLAIAVQSVPIFRAAQNVNVIGKADYAYPRGSTPISATLHGASILLRLSSNWDWFINLSAGDYPLVTQDDLLHILSYLPKDINFVNHTSYIGWKESRRLKPIIVDTGLHLLGNREIYYATQKRDLPTAFRLFSGSSFSILSRSFIEFCILGTDNLPRTLLMYFANMPYSLPNYFSTVVCNSHQFKRTVINDNLQYIAFNQSFMTKPHQLSSAEFDAMILGGAAFASAFAFDDPVLDRIDREILERSPGKVVPGGWCLGEPGNRTCSVWGDADILRPGPGARRLEKHIVELLTNGRFHSRQCMVE
ncbi:hypothetical protein SLEP1_g43604 [Rubroshorea leprosula]|uniref:Beta-glucuronosyltransferase GlcAT14A n=1 Tax=Rubroshorea leprosula TaxID=152421 RepID=A0AAV5LF28_9ROSI|nr:hypothetical protein SLEP1_g43604 [Rubroshorea leprosula]